MDIREQTSASDGSRTIYVLHIPANVDAEQILEMAEELDPLVEASSPRHALYLVANVSDLAFINSTGIGYFIKVQRALSIRGGEIVIAEPSAFFRTVIDTLGLESTFRLFDRESDAIAACDTA
ncbi:MAG: STAS domain-containing protein [Planctomycetota bacterium]